MDCGPRPLKFESTRRKMNARLLILRVESERRDAQNERDGAGLRSSVAAAAPSQLRRTVAAALQPSTQLVASLLEVLLAAPRGGTRRHLEGGRALRAASAPSQQHQLRRSSSRRRRQCPATIGQPLEWAAPRTVFRRPGQDKFSNCLRS